MTRIPIIFAPGMMCDERLFAEQISRLRQDHNIGIANFSADSTISEMAHGLLQTAPDRFVLIGLSMGGIVALDIVRQHSHRLAGLVLMDTTPFADSPARIETRQRQIQRVQEGHLREVILEEMKPNYLSETSRKDQQILDTLWAMARDLGTEAFIRQSQALMSRKDSTGILADIDCPTTIICGEDDQLCPPELHEVMHAGIQGSQLHILPDCGHIASMEQAEKVNDLIRCAIEESEG